ncbi:hypothetical protein H257_12670 [Aphanomyces astaci]|uniref:Uncharacterized protein n=1 Tax=Aphanomyces astaci TaxID=112090 RepID=W4FXG7_APHAT|nr:hypothetical protein H257_12670 [Aphanomyces astaci]ETV72195.1 hypothetical protein H257_12670 [Aphanomyces astaci]|eukprot:XP_009838263.1 hypothetical protein H257_12670 [Aphanomyces astaci]
MSTDVQAAVARPDCTHRANFDHSDAESSHTDQATCIDLTEDDGTAALPAFLWQDKTVRRVPEGWEFPAYPMDEMWFMWFLGDVDDDFRVISPFRLLSSDDFDDAESQLRLVTTQQRMSQLMEVLPTITERVTTGDDLAALARKDVATFEALYTRACSAVDGEATKSSTSFMGSNTRTTTEADFDASSNQLTRTSAALPPTCSPPYDPQTPPSPSQQQHSQPTTAYTKAAHTRSSAPHLSCTSASVKALVPDSASPSLHQPVPDVDATVLAASGNIRASSSAVLDIPSLTTSLPHLSVTPPTTRTLRTEPSQSLGSSPLYHAKNRPTVMVMAAASGLSAGSDEGAVSTAMPCREMWRRWFVGHGACGPPLRDMSCQEAGLSALSYQIVHNTMQWLSYLASLSPCTPKDDESISASIDDVDARYDSAIHRAPSDLSTATVYQVYHVLAKSIVRQHMQGNGSTSTSSTTRLPTFDTFPLLSLAQVWLRWFHPISRSMAYGRRRAWEASAVSTDRLHHAQTIVDALVAIAIEYRYTSSVGDLEAKTDAQLMEILSDVFATFQSRCLIKRRGRRPSINSKVTALYFAMKREDARPPKRRMLSDGSDDS